MCLLTSYTINTIRFVHISPRMVKHVFTEHCIIIKQKLISVQFKCSVNYPVMHIDLRVKGPL